MWKLLDGTVMRNLSVALAITLTVFGKQGTEIALIIAIAYIIQIKSAAWYVKYTDKIFENQVKEYEQKEIIMPLFAYVCKNCGEQFDLLMGVTSEKPELKCKKCGSRNIEKLFGAFSVGSASYKSSSLGSSCPTGRCNL